MLVRPSQGPPERFRGKNEEIGTGLLLLLRPEYPMVLNDDDLLEMNLHLDERDGHVTGIVDWADAIVSPFGMSLRRLETILGVQTSSCWHFHANHGFLRALVRQTFHRIVGDVSDEHLQAMQVERQLGIFRTHAFDGRPEMEGSSTVAEGDPSLVCLEAWCLG
ncbi:hypothetical protein RJ55_04293 [Drechmeria coniospora]|nr:hypothetical protein RJ55_04293 [Drechmeria coniospora]